MADSMGLVCLPLTESRGHAANLMNAQGKTLTMLALILATQLDIPTDYSKATLIGSYRYHHAFRSFLMSV